MKPAIIQDLEAQLIAALTEDISPVVSIEKIAPLCGMHPATFRKMMYRGDIPFAIGTDGQGPKERGYGVVPKLAVWNWFFKNESGGSKK